MSKHLLYCKDLPNRGLIRSLLFVVPELVFCLIVLFQPITPTEAAGPLSVKTSNPRYFVDSKGNPVYLTGSYLNEYNLLSGSWDFASYLDYLQQQKQNFTRVWGWEQSPWTYNATGQVTFSTQPYERTGPGLALDGGLKFDLTRFNQVYFDQLRSRIVEAAQRGIYVSVALFEGFSTQKKMGRVNPWLGDPFQQANNINGINGDPNQNGGSEEFFSLAFPSLVSLQEAFTRKVVDTLNDLDNVLYEVNGNGLAGSLSWQYHMIDYIRRYQKKTANQYPVGISDFYAGSTAEVLNSSADWIVIQETNLNPPPATLKKILIVEASPSVSGSQIPSNSAIALVQVLPDSVSIQSSSISNKTSSEGVTLLSSSATSSALATTQSSSNKNQQSQVATPTITPNGGVYSSTVAVTLQTTTPGASIYYTTDGQSPTQSSRLYNGKFNLSGSTLVKAKAFKNNFDPSAEASAWFANAASPAVAGSGLVAYWKFDEGSGTSITDSSGNGNTGTLVNGPLWTAGRVGNALFFDGIDDNVTVPDSASLDLSNSFTLSAWVNPASTFTDYRAIVAKNYKYYLYASSTGFCGDGGPMGGFYEGKDIAACQPSPLPANTWTHLSVTYNGSTITLYRNGVAVATYNVSGTLSPTTGTLQIGASQYGEYFKGLIDEVRIYNRALSDTEIQTIYQQDSAIPVQIVATPVISPNSGSYSGSVSVTMQTGTSGASIYYTTNGSSPTQSSTLYTGAMPLTSSATVKAKAFKSGSTASAEASASFTVTQAFGFSLANSGDISTVAGSSVTNSISTALTSGSSQTVSFSVSGLPSGATGSFSTASCSPACSSALTINTSGSTPAGGSTITVTAIGGGVTKTTTFSLTVGLPTVAMPVISPGGGSYTGSVSVTMQTGTTGASIYYTTNGSSPTQSSTLYTGAITLTTNAIVKAKAFKSGYNASSEGSASFTVAPNVAPSGLVAYWKFDEGSGTSITDSSGNGNNGTLVNGPLWTAGRVGNALFFDGIDDNVTVADSASLDLSNAFTLSAWVNPASTFTDYRAIVAKNYKYYLYASSTGFCGDGGPMGGFYEGKDIAACQPSPLPANTWTHLSVTYNGSTITLYRDGVTVATYAVSGTLSPTTGTLQIGASQYGEYFKGLIDEVRIYNRALSATEIQTLYQQDAATTVQTVATPVISPNGGTYSGSVSVTMQTATSGASIYYTTNGSTPTTSSTLYTGTMTLTSSATVKAKAFKSGSNGSTEASASFTVTQPFSFALANSGDKSVIAGSSVTNSISTALVSGTAQSVTFSVSGLPSGATGSFSSTSCNPACSTILSVNTTGSTPAGNFPITISATGGGVTKTTAFTLGVTLALTAATPTGNIYYVAKTGSDSNSCTQAQSQSAPKLTIAAGIACLAAGDTLNIKAGTYNESFSGSQFTSRSGTSYNSATTIQAYGSDVVTINGGIGFGSPGSGLAIRYIIFKADPVLHNLIFDCSNVVGCIGFGGGANGGSVDHIRLYGIEAKNPRTEPGAGNIIITGEDGSASDIWISNAKLHGHACGSNNLPAHGIYVQTPNTLVEHTEIYDIAGYGIHNYAGNPSNNTYRHNWIHDTGHNAPCGSITSFAILLTTGDGSQAYGNLITNNQNGIAVASSNNIVYNNTVYGNGIGFTEQCCYPAINVAAGSLNYVKNNIAYGNNVNSIMNNATGTVVSNNLTTDPKFVDPALYNFQLQSGSLAIDAGTSNIATGISIPFNGSAPDIGAFEY